MSVYLILHVAALLSLAAPIVATVLYAIARR